MTWLPLLQLQRDLLDAPRGSTRFRQYLATMVGPDGELQLPLAAFNPMSKPHVSALLDRLLAMDAEAAGAQAAKMAAARLGGPSVRLGLVLADDAAGGWTNRTLFEAQHLFGGQHAQRTALLSVLLWSSDEPSLAAVEQQTAATLFRHCWIARHGFPRTLLECLTQEDHAAHFAGVPEPPLPAAEAARIEPHLHTTHYPTLVACLYGDDAAAGCGYDPLGLSPRAGFRFGADRLSPADFAALLQTLHRAR